MQRARRSSTLAWRSIKPSRSSPSNRPVTVARVTPACSATHTGQLAYRLVPKALTLSQTPEGFGVVEAARPFSGAAVAQRVGVLRTKQVECAQKHKAGDNAGYKLLARDIYNDLRMTWEHGVEEVLLNDVVLGFRKGIKTSRLKRVSVESEDVTAITVGMSKCSNYTGHDGTYVASAPLPSPEEIAADINVLGAWRKSVQAHRERKYPWRLLVLTKN